MPVTIKLTFPGGRYHATPWGRHVNEGVPEWPPSPWRMLRALVAVWKRTCPDLAEEQVKRILTGLSEPPHFRLPPHRVAHTRHYMPWEKKGPQDRTMVFDTFVSVGRRDALFVGWPTVDLGSGDQTVLSQLLGNLTSLGRAEGWVHAELCEETTDWNCVLAPTNEANPVPVLCPDPATAFASEHYPKRQLKKPAQWLFDCPAWHLCLDTETIHAERWPAVPGSRWVNYTRPGETTLTVSSPRRVQQCPTVARFLLDGPVLPLLKDSVRVAEVFRRCAMGKFRRWCERHPDEAEKNRRTDKPEFCSSRTFSGKELDGTMRKDHLHAYYLPTAEGDDPRRITHVTVYASEGLGEGEVAALASVRRLDIGNLEKLVVQQIGLGKPDDFTAPILKQFKQWKSVTPFIVHRHLKKRGRKRDTPSLVGENWRADFAKLALEELLQRLGYPNATATVMPPEPGKPRGIDFRRGREIGRDNGYQRAFGMFRLNFSEPVQGPLAIGHDSHFGLGLFAAEE